MNTMEHSVLKISPSQLLFGNSLDHDVHFISHPKEYRVINKIIDHKFSRPRKFKADLQLLILWDDEKEPQWSSWSKSLGEKERVHKCLDDNYMARFTPRKFTWSKDHPNYEPPAWSSRRRKATDSSR